MLLPAERLLEMLQDEIARLKPGNGSGAEVSTEKAMAVALNLLTTREQRGASSIRTQFDGLIRLLDDLLNSLSPAPAELGDATRRLVAKLRSATELADIHLLEQAWRDSLYELENLLVAFRSAEIGADKSAEMVHLFATWETGDLSGQLDAESLERAFSDNQVNRERLTDYLRDRFGDPSLDVVSFQPLPGGFGKQTYLFDVNGGEINGSFVMRRDFPRPLVDNDCHRIRNEYAVIRAVHSRGFPAPEALWLDTEHRLLPGGDFIIMRRSPGVSGGTVIQANSPVPDDLAETLAQILARLHGLGPMQELSRLTESINADRWAAPLEECVRQYLQDHWDILRSTSHLPSPAIVSLMGWLLDNIPAIESRPVLLHGDIGFHNFLFDSGHLTAVLDWEFAHIGDPAEELASVRNNLGDALNWGRFMEHYRQAGGIDVDEERVHFYRVWGHVRNALTSSLAACTFLDGHQSDIKIILTPHIYIPHFIRSAQALIKAGYK